jgi:hypothetical protein
MSATVLVVPVNQSKTVQVKLRGEEAAQVLVRGRPQIGVGKVVPLGPVGPAGEYGPPGPPGPPGPATGGKRWYGEGPPGVIVGAEPRDEYVDILTGDLYVLT